MKAYVDGSILRNPDGPGGWAYRLVAPDPDGSFEPGILIQEGSGSDPSSTNNRMELEACIQGVMAVQKMWSNAGAFNLQALRKLQVLCDSQYCVRGVNEWSAGWIRNGWINSQGQAVANQEQWKKLLAMIQAFRLNTGYLEFVWLRGHAGQVHNEGVDKLARAAALDQDPQLIREMARTGLLSSLDDLCRRVGAQGYTRTLRALEQARELLGAGH
jgi:ribonuclease HI